MKVGKKTLGMLAALTANVIFGFSFIFSKSALEAAHPLTVLAVRFTVAFLALNLILLTGKIKLDLRGKPKGKLLAMGIAQPLLYFVFELYGLSLVSSAFSGVIISLVPVGVILLSTLFLREKPTPMQWVCTVLSIAGVSAMSILSDDGAENKFTGVLLLLGAVICASVFNVLSRGEATRFSPFERTYVMFLLGAVGFNIIAFSVLKGRYISSLFQALSEPGFLISIVYLAILSSVGAFLLYNYSTSVITATQSASFSNIITVVTVLAGVVILKESFSLWEYLLCVLIIFGVWGVNCFTVEKNKKK